jgi:hypothetical protein
MIRRKFLGIISLTIVGVGAMAIFSFKSSFLRKIFYKIQNRINPPSEPKPDSERAEASLPREGVAVSVEMALNSRCTSDYDDNPKNFHWGMFDKTKKLTQAQVEQIITHARIPRFTDASIEIKNEKNMLTFTIDNHVTQLVRDWAMVESGMQQQALGLVCAALGSGYVFSAFGEEGKSISEDKFATVRIKLDAMKPSYDGAYWSSFAPLETKPWKSGTLPDPIRQGTKPLLATLEGLKTTNDTGRQISANDLGQLLWAARGRTPHFRLSDPWGMTIPTYHGLNNLSEIYVISDGKISKYINWKDDRPTNSLEQVGRVDAALQTTLSSQYKSYSRFIVLSKNENLGRASLEIGFQMMNLLVQGCALGINYQAVLLDENQKEFYKKAGITGPVALLAV